jgi:hypothetical protein
MDLLSIARKLWRYKLVTLPVVLLTLCGAAYVVAVKEPVYEVTSSYILINPPAPPTEEQIARHPALGRVHADNPYTRFSDENVVVGILSSTMESASVQRALLKAGADPRYKVAPQSEIWSSPIVQVTARGATPAAAIGSAKLVSNALTRELDRRQQAEGVDPQYRIKARQVDAPDGAELRASGQLRMLVGVLALGSVLMFIVVSVADALTTLRRERTGHGGPSLARNGEPWPVYDGRAVGPSVLEPHDWSEFDEERAGSDQPISLFPDRDPGATLPTPVAPRKQLPYRRERRRS